MAWRGCERIVCFHRKEVGDVYMYADKESLALVGKLCLIEDPRE